MTDIHSEQRHKMVENQIIRRGVNDSLVLEAMRTVPRHLFVESSQSECAYGDHPLSIGNDQTISQPYIVALMTELLRLRGPEKVLEIGTGCGYQAAILAHICAAVYTIEIIENLALSARERLQKIGYDNINVLYGDGYYGYPKAAPYDAVIVTAAPAFVPQLLLDQLKVGGRMVIPIGIEVQNIKVIEKTDRGTKEHTDIEVRFVPMTGKAKK